MSPPLQTQDEPTTDAPQEAWPAAPAARYAIPAVLALVSAFVSFLPGYVLALAFAVAGVVLGIAAAGIAAGTRRRGDVATLMALVVAGLAIALSLARLLALSAT